MYDLSFESLFRFIDVVFIDCFLKSCQGNINVFLLVLLLKSVSAGSYKIWEGKIYSLSRHTQRYGYWRYKIFCRFTLRESLSDIITIQFVNKKNERSGLSDVLSLLDIFLCLALKRAITIIKTNRDKSHLVRKLKRNLNHNMDYAFSYTAISRKVVGKTMHATIPKGNTGYDQCTFPHTVAAESTFVAFL